MCTQGCGCFKTYHIATSRLESNTHTGDKLVIRAQKLLLKGRVARLAVSKTVQIESW